MNLKDLFNLIRHGKIVVAIDNNKFRIKIVNSFGYYYLI